jgi:hypothetical protein
MTRQGAWIATSLTLLAMTATFAMTSQIAVIARPKAAAIHEVQGAWIATSLTLLAMTATFAMTSQIAVIANAVKQSMKFGT